MSVFKKILVPVDASECATHAVERALDLALDQQAAIHFVHVLNIHPIVIAYPTVIDAMNAEAEVLLDRTASRAGEKKVLTTKALLITDPKHPRIVDQILLEATNVGADLIIAGTHGKGSFETWFLGGVAEALTRRSSLPVMLVPSGR